MELLVDGYRTYMHLPDPEPAFAVLGLAVADRMKFDGRAPWLLLNGGSGSGKTELLTALKRLPRVHQIDSITEAGMLSGVKAKDRVADATGGFLLKFGLGGHGIMLNMDLTSVISVDLRELKTALKILRRVYDGEYAREVGADGGTTIQWYGRLSFLAGVTQALDHQYHMVSEMGDRYCQIRMLPTDGFAEGVAVVSRLFGGDNKAVAQQELVADIVGSFEGTDGLEFITQKISTALVNCSMFSCLARSHVPREHYTNDIRGMSDPEAAPRMASSLTQIYAGMRALELDEPSAMRVCKRIALDSIPPLRRIALERIRWGNRIRSLGGGGDDWVTLAQIRDRNYGRPGRWATNLEQIAPSSIRRALQDLQYHGLIESKVQENTTGNFGYRMTGKTNQFWTQGGFDK
jgi:hypothetical protein